ncbi:leucine-rich repeat domain-containing protein [Nonomuraea sp. NBC_00507]|uniref:leucine-rich repeat protein n=1 Tax=Nonomuraea sp. NBC_00507 TaxID=2976002 RepID=UPI002E18B928
MAFGHGPYAKLSVLYLPSVTEIGANAFRRNQYLTKVNLPRVRTIDDFAFDDASRLRYFNAPELESIGRNGLNDSHVLEAVNLPELRYMGINCFEASPPVQDKAAFTGADPAKLIIYYTGDTSTRKSFVPAGNPTIKLVKRNADAPPNSR